MIAYGIGVFPLIRDIWDEHPCFTQIWYDDDVGVGGTFKQIVTHFRDLQARGAPWGYFLGPTKSISVVAPWNVVREEELFRGMVTMVVTRSRYLGGFIGNREAGDTWLAEKFQGWVELVKILLGVTHKHPQSAYTGLKKSLQQ